MDFQTAKNLDDIIYKLIEINDINKRTYLDLVETKKIFPDLDIKHLFSLLEDYDYNNHKIVNSISSKTGQEIYINQYTREFIQDGGFAKTLENSVSEQEYKKLKENIEFKKLLLEFDNLRKLPEQVRFNKKATIISLIMAGLSILFALIALFKHS